MTEIQAQSAEIGELAKALSSLQATLQPAEKDATNPFFDSKYASLTSCWQSCRVALAEHGFAVVQHGGQAEPEFQTQVLHAEADEKNPPREMIGVRHRVDLVTTLIHSSGEWIRGSMSTVVERGLGQDVAAAVTYLRRAGLCAIVGICVAEDSGSAPQSAPPSNERQRTVRSHNPNDAGITTRDIHSFGAKTYGAEPWKGMRGTCAMHCSNGQTSMISDLTTDELHILMDVLNDPNSSLRLKLDGSNPNER